MIVYFVLMVVVISALLYIIIGQLKEPAQLLQDIKFLSGYAFLAGMIALCLSK